MVLFQTPFFMWSWAAGPSAVRVRLGMAQKNLGLTGFNPVEPALRTGSGFYNKNYLPPIQAPKQVTHISQPCQVAKPSGWARHDLISVSSTQLPSPWKRDNGLFSGGALSAFVALFKEYMSLDLVNVAIHSWNVLSEYPALSSII